MRPPQKRCTAFSPLGAEQGLGQPCGFRKFPEFPKFPKFLVCALSALLVAGNAVALDYRSVAESAVLYDAPSQKAKPLHVIATGTPVEVIVTLDTWVKVRDMKGDLAWIERRQLADRRMLQIRSERAQVRVSPEEGASLVFEAEPDVLLEPIAPDQTVPAGWVKVRHRDGPQGFVKIGQVWGL